MISSVATATDSDATLVNVYEFQNVDSLQDLAPLGDFISSAIALNLNQAGIFQAEVISTGYSEAFQVEPLHHITPSGLTDERIFEVFGDKKVHFLIGGYFRRQDKDIQVVIRTYDTQHKIVSSESHVFGSQTATVDILGEVTYFGDALVKRARKETVRKTVALLGILQDSSGRMPLHLPLGKKTVDASWLQPELYEKARTSLQGIPSVEVSTTASASSARAYRFESLEASKRFLKQNNIQADGILYGRISTGSQLTVTLYLVDVTTGRLIATARPSVSTGEWPQIYGLLGKRVSEMFAGAMTSKGDWLFMDTAPGEADAYSFYSARGLQMADKALASQDPDDRQAAILYLRTALDYVPAAGGEAGREPQTRKDLAQVHFQLAVLLEKENTFLANRDSMTDAVANYHLAIERGYVDQADAYSRLAKAELSIGDYTAAAQDFKAALEKGAPPKATLLDLGMSYQGIRDMDSAVQAFTQYLELAPEDNTARRDLARAYHDQGKYSLELEQLQVLHKVNPADGKISEDMAVAHGGLGRECYGKKDIDCSIREYEASIAADPKWIPGYLSLGYLYLLKGDLDQAKDIVVKGMAVDPAHPDARLLNRLALTYQKQRDFAAALKYIDQAIAADPQSSDYKLNKSFILLQQGDMDKGITLLRELAVAKPQNRVILFNLAQMYRVNGDPAKAIDYLEQIKRLPDPSGMEEFEVSWEFSMDYGLLGDSEKEKIHYSAARKKLEEIVKAGRATPDNYSEFATFNLFSQKNIQEGIDFCNRALKDRYTEPFAGPPLAKRTIGGLYYENGQYEQARATLEESLPGISYPWQRAVANYYLGLTYKKLGKSGASAENFRAAVDEAPRFRYGVLARQQLETAESKP